MSVTHLGLSQLARRSSTQEQATHLAILMGQWHLQGMCDSDENRAELKAFRLKQLHPAPPRCCRRAGAAEPHSLQPGLRASSPRRQPLRFTFASRHSRRLQYPSTFPLLTIPPQSMQKLTVHIFRVAEAGTAICMEASP